MMTTRIYDKPAGQKRIFKAAPLRLTILLFLMLFVLMTGRAYAASDPKVISLAKRHKLTSAQIRPAGSSGKKLVCISKGKRLKKKNFWFYANGAVYYNNKKACVQTGSFTYKGFYYLADSEGKLQTNVYHDTRSCTYYYGSTGARLTNGWHTADGSQRYFDEKGRILTNRWIENQYVGSDGAIVSGLRRTWAPWNPSADPGGFVTTAQNTSEKHLIIVGASRVVYMSRDVPKDDRVTFIAQGGMGTGWLNNTAIPLLDFWLSVYPASKVVIQLGNNGIKPVSRSWPQLRAAYSYLLKTYPWVSFYFMDVLPGNLSTSKKKNKMRKELSRRIQKTFPQQWIGGYDYLVEKDFQTVDRIHYDKATNRLIYSYILREVGW